MPRYEYECETCHHSFELKQGFDSDPVASCPICQNDSRRKIHSVPIVFKGSGWYVNDYGKRHTVSSSETASDAASDSNSKKDSPSKPAEKAKSESGDKSDSTAKVESKAESTSAKPQSD